MRKKTLIIIPLILLVSLTSCGKVDEQTQQVIDDIDAIGEVSLDDGSLITKIEDEYGSLNDDQKKKVKNIDKLYDAKSEYGELEKAKPFPFSDVNWDTKKADIYTVKGGKPDDEGENVSGGYSYYYNDEKFEGYKVESNYIYENDSLTEVLLMFREVTSSDFEKIEAKLTEKYGEPKVEDAIRTWYSDNATIELNGAVMGFGMFKVTYIKP